MGYIELELSGLFLVCEIRTLRVTFVCVSVFFFDSFNHTISFSQKEQISCARVMYCECVIFGFFM
jgi:hypothetical protein